jgi:hypothetical protein
VGASPDAMQPFAAGVYVNLLARRAKSECGPFYGRQKYERLVCIKAKSTLTCGWSAAPVLA